jgi:GTP-dependent phosphoenolpyruvate carboxykinase
VRRDPFAMIPFCGYNMADYFTHWINFKKKLGYLAPRIFYVNWFRTDEKGRFLWPGFGENSRVLKWICERVDGVGQARATPIGYVPAYNALDTAGIDVPTETLHQLLHVDSDLWLKEMPDIKKFYAQFGDKIPPSLQQNLIALESRLLSTHNAPTQNKKIIAWVDEIRNLCKPENIHWCTGADDEYEELCDLMIKKGTLTRLDEELHPKCFVARSDPRDVIRVSKSVFICSETKESVGPTNNWADPVETKKKVNGLFDGCMEGRTMYIVPFCLGPIGSPYARFGVQITDSPYAVAGIRTMTRMGTRALSLITEEHSWVRCLHSVGVPLKSGDKDVPWPCNIDKRIIAHFMKEQVILNTA